MSLVIKSISKLYRDKTVLENISFEVSEGEVLGIVGPNGAGKSTLLRIVSGIIDANVGEVFWKGQKLSVSDAAAWGYLPEERGLYPQMKILDQLIHFAGLKGMSSGLAKEKAIAFLQAWKMEEYTHAKASELSKGNQQRIQFLACILHNPLLIILDEPFSGLDPVQADWLKQQIVNFKNAGKIVLYSSHRMDSVEALCDRVMVMHKGQRVAYSNTTELCKQSEEHWLVTVKGNANWMHSFSCLEVKNVGDDRQRVKVKIQESELATLLFALEKEHVVLESIQRDRKSLHEVFVALTGETDGE